MRCRQGKENHFRVLLISFICSLLTLTTVHCQPGIAWSREADSAFDFQTSNLSIFSHAGKHLIGHGRYSSSRSSGTDLFRGENQYFDGASDLELDYLKPGDSSDAPMLVRHDYSSFNTDGTPQFVESLDTASGAASCAEDVKGTSQIYQAILDVPPDTYAGATQLMFIVARLRQGERETIKFHSFNCAPGPKILSISVSVPTQRVDWSMYPGKLVRLQLQPDFGWLSILIVPFLPKLYFWFDPNDNWNCVGGLFDRYYKGPHIMIVQESSRIAP